MPRLMCLIALFLGVSACTEAPAPKPAVGPEKLIVWTMSLQEQPLTYAVQSFGQLRSAETVSIGSESPGVVERVLVQEGQHVEQGELLLELDADKQRFRLERAQANRDSIAADEERARNQLERFQRLSRTGAVSKDQLQQARSRQIALKAQLAKAESDIDIARRELEERRLMSPLSGVVASEPVEAGERIQPGQTLLTVQSDDALEVVTWVNQQEVSHVVPGTVAAVSAGASAEQFEARVVSVARSANTHTGNFEVKLRLNAADSGLREGMSAMVQMTLRSGETAILVPRSAVVDRDRRQVMFVVEDGVARRREPRFGLPQDDRIPVLSGLKPGEQLIVRPLEFVSDGVVVFVGDDT